jgi:hypothetical protein
MLTYLAFVVAAVLTVIAALHIYWAFGPRSTLPAALPTRPDGSLVFQPGVTACLGVALLLLLAAFLLIEQAGAGPGWLPQPWRAVGTAGVAIVLVLRGIGDFRYVGLFKRYRDTPFARLDTRFFTPLVLALGALAGVVALGHS